MTDNDFRYGHPDNYCPAADNLATYSGTPSNAPEDVMEAPAKGPFAAARATAMRLLASVLPPLQF
jgi:hypothetical protein